MRPISIVVPALESGELLRRALRSARAEVDRRGGADEILVVDDSGSGELEAGLGGGDARDVRWLRSATNSGFARALTEGIEAAAHELVFAMNSDLELLEGALDPLEAALEDREVFAAVPRVVRAPRSGATAGPERVESLARVHFEDGLLRLEQPGLEDPPRPTPDPALGPLPVPFALGGAMLFARADFRALGGFDPLFEPFYMEDVDLCWRAWRSGRRVLQVPAAGARHAGRATIGARVDPDLCRAVIERNLLLLTWKHLDGERALHEHLEDLERRIRAGWVDEDRRELELLALAFERLDQALASRDCLPRPRRSFDAIVRQCDPFAAAQRAR